MLLALVECGGKITAQRSGRAFRPERGDTGARNLLLQIQPDHTAGAVYRVAAPGIVQSEQELARAGHFPFGDNPVAASRFDNQGGLRFLPLPMIGRLTNAAEPARRFSPRQVGKENPLGPLPEGPVL